MKLLQENGKPNLAQDYDDLMQEEMNSYLRRWGCAERLNMDFTSSDHCLV